METPTTKTTDNQPPQQPDKPSPADILLQRVGMKRKSEDVKPPAAEPKDAKPADKPATAPAKAPEKKVERKKSQPQPTPSPAVDPDLIAGAVSTGVREALKKEEPKQPDPLAGLSEANKKRHRILERMVKNGADAELPKRFLNSISKLDEYRKNWENQNPGKKFSLEDEEHSDFLTGNDVSWDEDAYIEALTDLKAEAAAERGNSKYDQEIETLKRSELARSEVPIIYQHRAATARILFNELGDAFKDVLKPDGSIDGETIRKLNESNDAYDRVWPIANEVEEFAGEVMSIARGHKQLSEKNPLHQHIIQFALNQEKAIKNLPSDQQLNQHGKVFATSDEWEKMSAKEREKRWHLTDADLSVLYASERAADIKKLIDEEESRFKKMAERRGYKASETKRDDVTNPPGNGKTPDISGESHRPPPSTITPRMAPMQKNGGDGIKPVADRLFGR